MHQSYFHIPQVLLDMAQTLADVAPAKVANRASASPLSRQAFQMELLAAVPRRASLERRG